MPDSDLLAELARFIERITAIAGPDLPSSPTASTPNATRNCSKRPPECMRSSPRERRRCRSVAQAMARAGDRRLRRYVTAASGCGVIAFNERDEILLIQRPTGEWWYPTGFCDVGVSPAENAAKEAREETGLIVEPERLIAVIDSQIRSARAAFTRCFSIVESSVVS